jgi:hypothetical protein
VEIYIVEFSSHWGNRPAIPEVQFSPQVFPVRVKSLAGMTANIGQGRRTHVLVQIKHPLDGRRQTPLLEPACAFVDDLQDEGREDGDSLVLSQIVDVDSI